VPKFPNRRSVFFLIGIGGPFGTGMPAPAHQLIADSSAPLSPAAYCFSQEATSIRVFRRACSSRWRDVGWRGSRTSITECL
jgi:hypothetical protein